MKNKSKILKYDFMKALTLFITFIMMAFTLQYTIIDFINLNDTLTQNILQNPISEEEEEEKANETKDFQFYHKHFLWSLFNGNEEKNSYFKSNCFWYENNFIKTLNQPPEHSL